MNYKKLQQQQNLYLKKKIGHYLTKGNTKEKKVFDELVFV